MLFHRPPPGEAALGGPGAGRISHFFDMSSVKVGKYVSGCPVQIEMPSYETVQECGLIIIFANEYTQEIMYELNNKFFYKGDVLCFDDDLQLKIIESGKGNE